MSYLSKIQWTDATWNPCLGCSKISPGCKGCYAIRQVHRLASNPNPKVAAANAGLVVVEGGKLNWSGMVRLISGRLSIPLRVRQPRRWFVNSLSDLFHESLPDSDIDRVFAVMAVARWHTFQVLTKRADRLREYFNHIGLQHARIQTLADQLQRKHFWGAREYRFPIPNVHLGVSVENQETADQRIPLLLQTPAAVRFVSYEPALGPVDLNNVRGLDWVIVGGESGPGARPFNLQWARNVIAQCGAAGVPVFVKQLGARPFLLPHERLHGDSTFLRYTATGDLVPAYFDGPIYGQLEDKKGGNIEEWPEDLRVREFPK